MTLGGAKMTFFVDLTSGIAAGLIGKQLENLASRNKSAFIESYERYREGSLGIFVFGPQGTGKTTLMNVLSGSLFINDVPPEYSSSIANEKEAFKGHLYFKVYSGPGQETLADIHWPQLFEKMSEYSRVLCIFCCSFGCHTSFDIGGRVDVNDYLRKYKGQESAIFLKFCEQISAIQGQLGLMLLVTKQDLWWDKRDTVEGHYTSAKFARGFRLLSDRKKAVGFVGDRASASLSIQNLLSADKQLLMPTVGGYDQLIQKANFANFNKKLEAMISGLQ